MAEKLYDEDPPRPVIKTTHEGVTVEDYTGKLDPSEPQTADPSMPKPIKKSK